MPNCGSLAPGTRANAVVSTLVTWPASLSGNKPCGAASRIRWQQQAGYAARVCGHGQGARPVTRGARFFMNVLAPQPLPSTTTLDGKTAGSASRQMQRLPRLWTIKRHADRSLRR